MKRLTRNTILALLFVAPVPILAHGDASNPEASHPQKGMNGMMTMDDTNGMMVNGHMMDDEMMPMMMQCASMMEDMHPNGTMRGGMGHHMDSDSMMNPRTSRSEGAKYDAANAEALARAYLHGRNPESVPQIEILGAILDAGRYTVTYQLDGTQGVVLVDAATGTVLPEDAR